MARINIICYYNAHGLAKDGRLMAEILRQNDHDVIQADLVSPPLSLRLKRKLEYKIKRKPIYDINIHVESCVPSLFHLARRNILLPNLEALRPETAKHLETFDGIFCKTQEAYTVLRDKGLPVSMVGFSTPARRRANRIPNWRSFFHASGARLPGAVSVKGTDVIYRVWSSRPDWPTVTMTGCHYPSRLNINCINGYVTESKYIDMQNESGIHLCPSEMEGFGHYIVEPMSAGCVVATTDGAPMNELISPDRGFLIKTAVSAPYMLGRRYSIDELSFEETIDEILGTSEDELRRLAMKARSWYEQNDAGFRRKFLAAIDEILT